MTNLSNKIDIFGLPLTFEEEESSKVATFGGLVGSFITMAFVLAMSILFGKELIRRIHPFSITSEEHIDISSVYLKEMPLIFNFILDQGERLDGNLYFEMDIYQFYTYENITSDRDLYLKKCDYRDYTKHQDWVKKKTENSTVDYLCLAHNNNTKIVNPYGYHNSTFIHISFRKCDSTKRKCADDIDKVLSDIYVQMLYQDAYVDVNDNDNPIKYYENIVTSQNSLSFLKRNYIRFRNDILSDDSGWLLENYNTTEFTTLGSNFVDINPNMGRLTDNLYWMTFESPTIRKKISRSYMKLQDLLAKIGGIVKGTVVIVELMLIFYTRFKYSFFVIKCVLNSEEDFKNLAIEQINIFSVFSKKFPSITIPKTVENNEIRSFNEQEVGDKLRNNLRSLNNTKKEIIKIDNKIEEKNFNEIIDKEKSIIENNQDSIDQKDKSNIRILNVRKNNFINERKKIEEKIVMLNEKDKSCSIKIPKTPYQSVLLGDADFKFRNEFKKMMTEVHSLDSYWLFIWSSICLDKKKIKLYQKYNTLFSKLISFKKMIKIRSRVNNELEILNKGEV